MNTPIAVTSGDPAGIGPDILLMLVQEKLPAPPVAVASTHLLRERSQECGLPVDLQPFDPASPPPAHTPGTLWVWDVPLNDTVVAGHPKPANADYVLDTLRVATQGCMQGVFHALTTGPVHKSVINEAGVPFSGHTEFLGELTGADPVMMLATDKLRVALVTTHLPLKEVSHAITPERLERVIRILHRDLEQLFSLANPRIKIAGLNPHAGEGGHIGREEVEVIEPVINKLNSEGLNLRGPLPADTLFTPPQLADCDAVLAMYHDQGLPVLKHIGFGLAVNITLGLPLIRTSVDHGTAMELAGKGKASADSLHAAFTLAATLKK